MISKPCARLAGAALACLAVLPVAPAGAVDGVILITQEKALAGHVTPGDTPGFPVTLSTSGSYRLAGNLQVPANHNGIVVAAQNVSIDLNGFQLAGGTVAAAGILEGGGNRSGITIRNGTITGFKRDAIKGTGSAWMIEGMRITSNGGNGVAAGHLLHVRDSVLYLNKRTGVTAVNQATIQGSIVVGSGAHGIVCENHCLISGSMISQNGVSSGGFGVSANLGTVFGNTISGNGGFGISGSATGYGNNTLIGNNNAGGGGTQVSVGLMPLQPNACTPAC